MDANLTPILLIANLCVLGVLAFLFYRMSAGAAAGSKPPQDVLLLLQGQLSDLSRSLHQRAWSLPARYR